MDRKPADPPPIRLVDIVTIVSVMIAAVVVAGRIVGPPDALWPEPGPLGGEAFRGPIAAEADIFRVTAEGLSVAPDFVDDRAGHVRSVEIYRRLRAYPGAPPRVPHGLTDEEYRRGTCNLCHERGGWVARFGTYAPVTPHPQYGACLQCHAARDELVGVALPSGPADVVCAQCHVDPDAQPGLFVASDWRGAAWAETDLRAMPESPHRIPHRIEGRGNCLACHAGPAAIAEIRTDHPERVNCRQCHVPTGDASGLPMPPMPGSGEGAP
ncbi:MAG: hypothetical protein OEN56_13420 [Gemmatimonadota bacterium]|nr:hypothetical protein [Gemmatimonadota bacterium]